MKTDLLGHFVWYRDYLSDLLILQKIQVVGVLNQHTVDRFFFVVVALGSHRKAAGKSLNTSLQNFTYYTIHICIVDNKSSNTVNPYVSIQNNNIPLECGGFTDISGIN